MQTDKLSPNFVSKSRFVNTKDEISDIDLSNESLSNQEKMIEYLRNFLKSETGIELAGDDRKKLEQKVNKRMIKTKISSFEKYLMTINENRNELLNLIGQLTINHTDFFRSESQWKFLMEEILPEWQTRESSLQAWSAGCADGREPYSLSMILQEKLESESSRLSSIKILATDIAKPALSKATQGKFSAKSVESIKNFKEEYHSRYLTNADNKHHELKEKVKQNIMFRMQNLKDSDIRFKQRFDIIFCRNVLMYFSPELTQTVVKTMIDNLKAGGYLFIGAGETLLHLDHDLQQKHRAIYQKS